MSNLCADTINLDFTRMQDGTPLSAVNPYAGILDFDGEAGAALSYGDTGGYPEPGETWADAGVVEGGVLVVATSEFVKTAVASLEVTFLQPVKGLVFVTKTVPWNVEYSYEGIDQNGNPFSGLGVTPFDTTDKEGRSTPYTTVLNAPNGGHFTELHLWNWSYGYAGFSLNSLTLQSVPEPPALSDKALLLVLAGAAPFFRRAGQERAR
jgi:hypothetical protein